MGLISEIKKKSKHSEAPELEINSEEKAKLLRGEAILKKDKQSGESYLIRVKIDKLGSDTISHKDLDVEKVKIPAAAKERDIEL